MHILLIECFDQTRAVAGLRFLSPWAPWTGGWHRTSTTSGIVIPVGWPRMTLTLWHEVLGEVGRMEGDQRVVAHRRVVHGLALATWVNQMLMLAHIVQCYVFWCGSWFDKMVFSINSNQRVQRITRCCHWEDQHDDDPFNKTFKSSTGPNHLEDVCSSNIK